jgi:hypothetical protein
MFRRIALVALLVLPGLPMQSAEAATPSQRAAIRSMPITQRPNRPGHFYGNTVRAFYRLSGGR